MLITQAPPAAPITLNSDVLEIFKAASGPGVCYLTIAGSSRLDMQLLAVIATGSIKPNQPGEIEIGLFAHAATPHEEPPDADTGSWVLLGASIAEPVGGADDLPIASWMVKGVDLMFNLKNGKMQGQFQSNVADNPQPTSGLSSNPNDIDKDLDPLLYFAIAARFTPTDDDGSTPEIEMDSFILAGEV